MGFWVLAVDPVVVAPFALAVQAALVLLACVEKLRSIVNMVAIERQLGIARPPLPTERGGFIADETTGRLDCVQQRVGSSRSRSPL